MAAQLRYRVRVSPTAVAQLKSHIDGSVRSTISEKIELLREYPAEIGKPLTDELMGYYRIVAAGRYRVVYRISEDPAPGLIDDPHNKALMGLVQIACIGIRKKGDKVDVYATAARLAKSGELA